MIKISRQTDYAIQLLSSLPYGQKTGVLSLNDLAEKRKMSKLFLQKVARSLRRSGLIGSERGRSGGFFLVKKLEDINLLDLVQAIEGDVYMVKCLKKTNNTCTMAHECRAKSGVERLSIELRNFLQERKLVDILS